VMMQAQILELLENMRRDLGIAMILITHDLSVLAETCDRVAIMYAGRIVERGPVDRLYATPHHPYTRRLLSAFPAIGGERTLAPPIPGGPPDPLDPVEGCPFHPRCHMAREECRDSRPEHRDVADGHSSACHFAPWPPGALDEPDAMFGREARR
jgi:peptide/nickel transport system ATP-binding protein